MIADRHSAVLPLLVAEWPRNARETIRVRLDAYRGTAVVDVRSWFIDAASGEMRPGRDAVTLAVRHLPDLAAALVDAHDACCRLGLLTPDD